jgi:glycosyltransferase involved in cell wall biosynthesis
MGDMIEYTPGSYNQTFFWPLDLAAEHGRRYEPHYPDPASSAPVRILHAPNHRGFKGSQYLIAAVEKLRKEGLPIELVLVEKVPNRQALELYRTADIVFDQCLIGFHGYFALEAMALGKPVMVYIRDPERYLLAPDECPFINAHRDKIEPLLRELVSDRPRLRELGVQGRKYIEKYFTFSAFAARLKLAYQETGLQSYKESLHAWNATSSGRETTEIESALNARGNAA